MKLYIYIKSGRVGKNNAVTLKEMECNEESQLVQSRYISTDEATCSPWSTFMKSMNSFILVSWLKRRKRYPIFHATD